ncbi:protein MpCHS-like [Marchantia polymorpha subsp. ruderalis]
MVGCVVRPVELRVGEWTLGSLPSSTAFQLMCTRYLQHLTSQLSSYISQLESASILKLPRNTPAIEVAESPSYYDLSWCMHPGSRAILDKVAKT